jgi:hypothetical protein
MDSCNVGHSYSATLTMATSIGHWSCQQRRRGANRSSLCNSRLTSTSSETNITVCHHHYTTSEEHYNDDDMNSSDCENSCVPPCVFVLDEELDDLINSHDKLNILDNTQECLNNSHRKTAFDYGEDTPLTIIAIKLRLKHLNIIIKGL